MVPITWNVNDKSTHLNVDLNGYGVNYTGRGKNIEDAVIRTTNPIPLQCRLFYFEIDIINNDDGRYKTFLDSWGYHSDDGNFFDCSEIEEPYGPTFKTGDTIGCCLDFRNNTVFYTKNGLNLGIVFRDLKYNELHEKKRQKRFRE
ncbi:concanavalin A-like lectin/glucanase domain-containing protein [Gigaspora rosea]|uniref:Concanavalin A-like lectin/glucanase domain-containing protein n=1 Tax=Gigaspora rosea TaxID=44941 RepID=A0A397V3U3_9GLOM|nr:concanavalin A-like lectin/glucanase domain-containing protein [Gigaspora rosea]